MKSQTLFQELLIHMLFNFRDYGERLFALVRGAGSPSASISQFTSHARMMIASRDTVDRPACRSSQFAPEGCDPFTYEPCIRLKCLGPACGVFLFV